MFYVVLNLELKLLDRIKKPSEALYTICIKEKPLSLQGTSKFIKNYKNRIIAEAKKNIANPINKDIGIEITWTSDENKGRRSDLDNIIKPIIDALIGIAYNDDKQIRTIVANYYDRNKSHKIGLNMQDFIYSFFQQEGNVVVIRIYNY